MKRAAILVAVLLFFGAGFAIAQSQGWQANQDAQQFTLTNASQVGVGTLGPSPSAAVAIENSQNAPLSVLVANPSTGAAAAATTVYQDSATYGVPPYVQIGTLGSGYSESGAPFFGGGVGVITYNGQSGIDIDVGTTVGGTPPILFTKHTIGLSQTIMGAFDFASQAFSLPATLSGATDALVYAVAADGTLTRVTTGAHCSLSGGVFDCTGSGGTGTVTVVTATAPLFITSTPTTTPNVTIQGALVSGSTSTTAQNLGSISTSMLACATSAGVCTVDGVTVGGGLNFNTGTAAETLGSFTCGSNTFVSSSSTSGLACTQPTIGNLSAIAANTLVGNPTGASAVPVAVTLGACLNMTSGTSVDLKSGACGGTSTFGSGTTYVQSVTVDGYGKVQSAASASTLVCSLLPAVGGDLTSAGNTCSVQVIALEETSGPARLSLGAIPDLGSGNASVLNRPGGTGTVVGTDSRDLVVADELAFYVSYTLGVAGGYIATSSTSLFTTGTIEYPTSHVAKHANVCINLISNGIVTGTPNIGLNRNGSGIGGGSAVNFTSSSTPGVYCTGSFSTGSTSAADTYGIQQANSSTGTITYSVHVVLN